MDESKIILRTMQELNGPILERQYALLREHLASGAGQLTVGAAFAAEREQFIAKGAEIERWQEFEARKKEHEIKNMEFVRSTVDLLPGSASRTPRIIFPNTPENYLTTLGALDRTLFLPTLYHFQSVAHDARYVVGANTKKGLLVCGSDREGGYLLMIEGRQARKAAKHFSRIPGNLDPRALTGLYRPEGDCFVITESNGHTLTKYEYEILRQVDDATIHEFNVPTQLMHLTALFDVRDQWEKEVLGEYVSGVSDGQVSQLKGLLAAHSLPQITEK